MLENPRTPSDTEFATRGPKKNPSLSLVAKEGMKAIVAMNFPEVVKVPNKCATFSTEKEKT